jgi:hypothetical protein
MRQAITEQPGKPLDVVDPASNTSYVLIRADVYERVRDLIERGQVHSPGPGIEIPPGIRRSQEAFRRDLPTLLLDERLQNTWVAYHGDERIGFARTHTELHRECRKRGFPDDEFYIGRIVPTELCQEEEIDPSLFEFEDDDPAHQHATNR